MALLDDVLAVLYLLATLLGALILITFVVSVIIVIIATILLVYSIKTGKILFPNLLVIGIMFFEGPIKAITRLFGFDDSILDRISIDMQNKAMRASFSRIPFEKRAIFIPQCLRSVECPARLSPEGIKCKDCGLCEITRAKNAAEKLGYKFFVVPGSSFIVRMIRKYHPEGIIGVGCLCEVKEGLDLMHKNKVPSMGVVLERSGCVSTVLDWDKLFEVMNACDFNAHPGRIEEPSAAERGSPRI